MTKINKLPPSIENPLNMLQDYIMKENKHTFICKSSLRLKRKVCGKKKKKGKMVNMLEMNKWTSWERKLSVN